MAKVNAIHQIKDFILIIKTLFPHREVINPYRQLIMENENWDSRQKLLIIKLMKALTILHQNYRSEDSWGRFEACSEDFNMAVMLMTRDIRFCKPELLLSGPDRTFYAVLLKAYDNEPFTIREAMALNGLSKTGVHWKLNELISKGLAEHCGVRGQRFLYRIKSD